MSVDFLDGKSPFRIALTVPAEVVGSTIIVTSENLGGSGGAGSFSTLAATGALTVGGTSTLTGNVSAAAALAVGGALTVATNITATGGTTALRTLTVSQTSTLTGNVTASAALTVTGLLTANGGITAGAGGTTSIGSDLFAVGNTLTISNLTNVASMVLPTYADNAAALLGGLVATNLYKTATGEVRIVV